MKSVEDLHADAGSGSPLPEPMVLAPSTRFFDGEMLLAQGLEPCGVAGRRNTAASMSVRPHSRPAGARRARSTT